MRALRHPTGAPGSCTVDACARLFVPAWAVLWFAVMVGPGGTSWHWFVEGQQALADLDARLSGGLHLYSGLPYLQIGPVTFLATFLLGPAGSPFALRSTQLLGAAAGLLVLGLLRTAAQELRPELSREELDRRTAAVALFFAPVWTWLAVGVDHLDDVLALLFAVLALRAATTGRPILTGVLLGLAVDSKPWALPLACLLLLVPGGRRRLAGAAALGLVVAAAWMPFFLADPGTLRALHYTIPNTARSTLRVLGIDDPRTPGWVRPAQALLGLGLGALAIRRQRWAAVVLVVVASRLVLDPGTNRYYVAGLAVGAAAWDLLGARTSRPWWSAVACLGLFTSRSFGLPAGTYGALTLCFFLATGLLAVRPPLPPRALSPSRGT